MRKRQIAFALVLAAALSMLIAACGGGDEGGSGGGTNTDVSGNVSMMAVWTGQEQQSFQKVIDAFHDQYPNVTVKYTSGGDQLPTVLATAIEGGNPPDLAAIAQPGLMVDFANRGVIQSLDFAKSTIVDNFGESVAETGQVDGTQYGLLFKAANKSTVWFNVKTFEDAGVEAPSTWDDFLNDAKTLQSSGIPAYSIGGADGWTLTDLFENIYLRQAGPEKYDQLAKHEIPWTDPSVISALNEMVKVFKDTQNIVGGTSGALQTDFPTSVSNVFSNSPKAAMIMEGDFVPGVVESPLEPEMGYDFFDFPAINDSPKSVVGGGDTVVLFNDSPAARAFIEYLTTPEAAEIRAEGGGFSSPNKNVDVSVYPDPVLQRTAQAISDAEVFRFDLSDLQPAAFGATIGQGMWGLFQDLLRNPNDVQGIAQKLEQSATQAYK